MLVNVRDICAMAEQNNMAVAAFDTPSLEATRAAIEVAEQTGYPVILSHAEGHDPFVPLDYMGPTIVNLAERSSALLCVHLDHCEHLSYMRRALEMGFSGAMYDGSFLPYEQNVENSHRAAEMCAAFGAGLECELGSMGSREAGSRDEGGTAEESGAIYTNPDQAEEFVEKTGLDILACSFGTVHGLYKGEPHLNFDVLKKIRKKTGVPLVMHGGSGVSDNDYRKAINAGIRKINYYTYGVKYAAEAVRKLIADAEAKDAHAVLYWHDMTPVAYESFRKTFEDVVKVFANGAAPLM
jgi:fructose-bisphosphate aldolase class II